MKKTLLLAILLCCPCLFFPQDTLRIRNTSFEQPDLSNPTVEGWISLSESFQQPILLNEGKLPLTPRDGDSYLQLINAYSLSSGIQQRLTKPLLRDSIYAFHCYLARQPDCELAPLKGALRKKQPCDGVSRLLIAGRNSQMETQEFLAVTEAVKHTEWIKYLLYFKPHATDYDEFQLVSALDSKEKTPFGNLLIDRCSPIRQIPLHEALRAEQLSALFEKEQALDPNVIYLFNASFDRQWIDKARGWVYFFWGKNKSGESALLNQSDAFREQQFNAVWLRQLVVKAQSPGDGMSYTALRASKENIWESMVQSLEGGKLQKDSVYSFSIDLACASKFKGYNYWDKLIRYQNPLRLRIWGSDAFFKHRELLAETAAVLHQDWKRYEFELNPKLQDYDSLILEAFYISEDSKPYNGNLLLDNCSPIRKKPE